MHNFKQLAVWNKATQLTTEVYQATRSFPKDELYGITSQVRRAAVSICANIAEGCGRETSKEFRRFLDIANGSAFEVETLLIVAQNLEYLNIEEAKKLQLKTTEVQKMLFGLIKNLNNHVAEDQAVYQLQDQLLDT